MKKILSMILVLFLSAATSNAMNYKLVTISMNYSFLTASPVATESSGDKELESWRTTLEISHNAPNKVVDYTKTERCKDFGLLHPERATVDDAATLGVYYCQRLGLHDLSLDEFNRVPSYLNCLVVSSDSFYECFEFYKRLGYMRSVPKIKELIEEKLAEKSFISSVLA